MPFRLRPTFATRHWLPLAAITSALLCLSCGAGADTIQATAKAATAPLVASSSGSTKAVALQDPERASVGATPAHLPASSPQKPSEDTPGAPLLVLLGIAVAIVIVKRRNQK